jgi:hypothetical protein
MGNLDVFRHKWLCILIELVVVPSRGAGSMEAIRMHILSRSSRASSGEGGSGGGGGGRGGGREREKLAVVRNSGPFTPRLRPELFGSTTTPVTSYLTKLFPASSRNTQPCAAEVLASKTDCVKRHVRSNTNLKISDCKMCGGPPSARGTQDRIHSS